MWSEAAVARPCRQVSLKHRGLQMWQLTSNWRNDSAALILKNCLHRCLWINMKLPENHVAVFFAHRKLYKWKHMLTVFVWYLRRMLSCALCYSTDTTPTTPNTTTVLPLPLLKTHIHNTLLSSGTTGTGILNTMLLSLYLFQFSIAHV